MTIGIKDFILYMLFSGFEYLAIFFIIFSFFHLSFKYFAKEMLFGVLIITLASFFLVNYDLSNIVPLPVILIPATVLVLTKAFEQSWLRSVIVSIIGFVLYGVVQFSVGFLLMRVNYMNATDLQQPFADKSYVMQTICGTLAIVISIYVKLTNGGFGFTMSKKVSGRKGFVSVSLVLVSMCSIVCAGFYVYKTLGLLLMSLAVIVISVIVLFYLSYKRDAVEYS